MEVEDGKAGTHHCATESRQYFSMPPCVAAVVPPGVSTAPRMVIPDGEWGWIVVLAAFAVQCIVDGCCHSFVLFYIDLHHGRMDSMSFNTYLIVYLPPALFLLIGPLVAGLTKEFGSRAVTILGSVIAALATFSSSYTTNTDVLIVTYGVIGGLGFGMMHLSSVVVVCFYFKKWRGLALGFALSGSGVSTYIFSPMILYMLKEYGWSNAHIFLSGFVLQGVVCGALFRPLRLTSRSSEAMSRSLSSSSSTDTFLPNVGGQLLKKLAFERHYQKSASTGSLDGIVITKDNRLVHPNDKDYSRLAWKNIRKNSSQSVLTQCDVVWLRKSASTDSCDNDVQIELGRQEQPGSINNNLGQYDSCGPCGNCSKMNEVKTVDDNVSYVVSDANAFHRCLEQRCSSCPGLPYKATRSSHRSSIGVNDRRPRSFVNVNQFNQIIPMKSHPSNSLANLSTDLSGSIKLSNDISGSITESHNGCRLNSFVQLDEGLPSFESINNTYKEVKRNSGAISFTSTVFSNISGKKLVRLKITPVIMCFNVSYSIISKLISGALAQLALLKLETFILLCFASVLPFLGFFGPFTYIASYAIEKQADFEAAEFLLSVITVSNVLGRVISGLLVDSSCAAPLVLHIVNQLVCGAMTCLLFLVNSYDVLCVYAALFGFSVASFLVVLPIVAIDLFAVQNLTNAYGIICSFQGLAALFGTHLSDLVFEGVSSLEKTFLFSGSLIFAGGILTLLVYFIRRIQSHSNKLNSSK